MKGKMIFGALLVSVALCSQAFSLELLDRMLGLKGGDCGECNACAKVACCDPAAKSCCPEPACCEKACPKACDPACCDKASCGKECGKKCRATPVRDLFAGMKDLLEAKGCCCETKCCDPAKACCPEPACCEKACPKACEPACCDKACGEKCCKAKKCRKDRCCKKACDPCCPVAACDPACDQGCEKACKTKCHKLYRRPVVELLEKLFGGKDCCGEDGCCETACGCGGAAPAAPAAAPSKAPEAAPLPQAPKADPSAAVPSRGIYQTARSLVRN